MFSIANNFTAPPVRIASERKPEYHPRTYSQFIRGLKDKELPVVVVKPNESLARFQEENGDYGDVRIVQTEQLWETLIDSDAEVLVDASGPPMSLAETGIMLFIGIYLFSLFRAFFGSRGGGGGMPNPFIKSTEFTMEQEVTTRFTDVEGIDSAKEELEEIVDFLKKPERYFGSGAKIPRGALLAGAPGTGKTLLARAIAGESNVPFIQCSAANFVEMFVGVGAKRVRELFEQARANQPCIVFIDEIDAIGKKRGGTGPISNDEREQTINQLLTEMDGFDDTSQIVVIAATNRVDILDDALIRPGRFDRKIQVNLPNVTGRAKILAVHTKDKILGPDVSLKKIAQQTTGFSGADLANLMNECAIRAVRDGDGTGMITEAIVEDCFQRVVVGTKNKDMIISQAKKELVAYHEAGHAIVGALMPEYDQVRKVSIISRGNAGGVTFFQPSEENQDSGLYSKQYLLAQIRVALGGMVAEEVVYGEDNATTGASNDLAQVFMIARQMITNMGFGSTLGKQNAEPQYLSEATNREIDDEIHDLIDRCYEETRELLVENRQALELVKDELLEKEIIDGQFVYDLFKDCVELE